MHCPLIHIQRCSNCDDFLHIWRTCKAPGSTQTFIVIFFQWTLQMEKGFTIRLKVKVGGVHHHDTCSLSRDVDNIILSGSPCLETPIVFGMLWTEFIKEWILTSMTRYYFSSLTLLTSNPRLWRKHEPRIILRTFWWRYPPYRMIALRPTIVFCNSLQLYVLSPQTHAWLVAIISSCKLIIFACECHPISPEHHIPRSFCRFKCWWWSTRVSHSLLLKLGWLAVFLHSKARAAWGFGTDTTFIVEPQIRIVENWQNLDHLVFEFCYNESFFDKFGEFGFGKHIINKLGMFSC